MKTTHIRLTIATALLLGIYSCKKGEATVSDYEMSTAADSATVEISDSVSSVATMSVKDKQFIKTANVNMEVKEVYGTTISIEKSVQELGGFITHSNLQSRVISEDTYNTSDENAMLIKKYQTENTMQVRVPTSKLGELLTLINDKKLFLNSRIINAEDVTSSIKYAEMEGKRIKKTSENISELKTTKDKVKMSDENMSEENQQQLANLDVTDNLKYSTIDIYIKEPKVRIAEIAITNSENIDNKYKFDFFYSAKNAFVEGYYLIQRIVIGLIVIWPILLIGGVLFYFYRKNKSNKKPIQVDKE
ncbi:DUF4349 domain-containing protein [Chryseobacterium balustinum]|uniref:DUF4349 domain-containing protein n=1 Tax=Chryseobacterium balustinum TaxID=246 RepID=A0AAX2II47_9FLAO|nr:DUF4349 domain-containing protein [Chryseobacterium balustinum]AZB31535.1 DUF4349 domain-containing protein [Chryseobacterium balustinum]SKB79315.1 protein of unknown function [Chryseobacterium balustinum]SQA88285.1 Uncharacterised protein [Chryseobacterium balustinum]